MGENRRGNGLLKLVFATAVVVTALAISVPYVVHSRILANESEARESLHTLNLALFEYWTIYESYPKSLANLGEGPAVGVTSAGLLEPALANGRKGGYVFAYAPGELDFDGTSSTFDITAKPRLKGVTGRMSFSMDQTGVVRELTSAPTAATSATP